MASAPCFTCCGQSDSRSHRSKKKRSIVRIYFSLLLLEPSRLKHPIQGKIELSAGCWIIVPPPPPLHSIIN